MEKTYRFVRRLNTLALMGLVLVPIGLVVGAGTRPGDPISIATTLLVLAFAAFIIYRQKIGIDRAFDRRLVLDDTGLRYEISERRYSAAWNECDHHVVRLGRHGEVRLVTLVTRKGEWLPLNSLEDMPGVLAAVQQHVPAAGPRGLGEKLLLNPWFSNLVLTGLGLTGCVFFALSNLIPGLTKDQAESLGIVLLIPAILASVYIWNRNPLMNMGIAVQHAANDSLRRTFIYIAIWVALIIVVIIVLQFITPHHK